MACVTWPWLLFSSLGIVVLLRSVWPCHDLLIVNDFFDSFYQLLQAHPLIAQPRVPRVFAHQVENLAQLVGEKVALFVQDLEVPDGGELVVFEHIHHLLEFEPPIDASLECSRTFSRISALKKLVLLLARCV